MKPGDGNLILNTSAQETYIEELTPWAKEYSNSQMGNWTQRQTIALADIWMWMCGEGKLWSRLPRNWLGVCARVMIFKGVMVVHPKDGSGVGNASPGKVKWCVEAFEALRPLGDQ